MLSPLTISISSIFLSRVSSGSGFMRDPLLWLTLAISLTVDQGVFRVASWVFTVIVRR